MTDTHEIVKTPTVDPIHVDREAELHPLVQLAKQGGTLDVETLRELMKLQLEYESQKAKKRYTRAMVALKSEMPTVINRDSTVSFGNTRYTHVTLANAIDTVTPHLAKHGFELSWSAENDKGSVKTTCKLAHRDGHVETMTLQADPDKSGNKNSIQAVGSTITYLQRYSALSLLGIATADMTEYDPRAEQPEKIDVKKNLTALSYLKKNGISKDKAEEFVGNTVECWTLSDLSDLREMVKSEKQKHGETREPGQEG